MKHFCHIVIPVLLCGAALSCEKVPFVTEGREIVIGVDNGRMSVELDTKASAVTSIPGTMYWGTTSGARGSGSETRKYHNGSGSSNTATVYSNNIYTGCYQTASPTYYNHYVSNVSFSIPSSGNVTMYASNDTDVICGWAAGTNSTSPSVTLNHIFARTGTFTLSVPAGYSQSSVSWTIASKGSITGTAGTYNLSTGTWTSSSVGLGATGVGSGSDYYLIPGTYTITCSFTLSKGDFVQSYTQSCDVTLVGNKINNITATTTTDQATQIVISLSLTAWGTENVNGSLS